MVVLTLDVLEDGGMRQKHVGFNNYLLKTGYVLYSCIYSNVNSVSVIMTSIKLYIPFKIQNSTSVGMSSMKLFGNTSNIQK
jgi:hypothetical protein